MALSEQDKDWVKLIARELAFQVNKEVITEHIASCPHGKTILASKMLLVGMCVGSGFASGGVVFGLLRFISG